MFILNHRNVYTGPAPSYNKHVSLHQNCWMLKKFGYSEQLPTAGNSLRIFLFLVIATQCNCQDHFHKRKIESCPTVVTFHLRKLAPRVYTLISKKAFQMGANRPLPNRSMCQWQCGVERVSYVTGDPHIVGGSQCPCCRGGSSHMGDPQLWRDRLTDRHDWKHYLLADYVCGR